MKQLIKVKHPDRLVDAMQDNVERAVSIAINAPTGSGRALRGIVFPFNAQAAPSFQHPTANADQVLVDHGLGSGYTSWIITRVQCASGQKPAVIEPTGNPLGFIVDQTLQLLLESSVACTVDVWVS